MSRPPKKALEQIKSYCEKTQCRRCIFGDIEKLYDSADFVGCLLQQIVPCDWNVEEAEE